MEAVCGLAGVWLSGLLAVCCGVWLSGLLAVCCGVWLAGKEGIWFRLMGQWERDQDLTDFQTTSYLSRVMDHIE